MPIAETGTIIGVKAVAVGGLTAAILAITTNSETMMLLIAGVITSILSFFFEWAEAHPRVFTIDEIAILFKKIFYGVGFMFLGFYGLIEISSNYIELPKVVWGIISAFMAASAVDILTYLINQTKSILDTTVIKLKDFILSYKKGK